jgi:hypothetical protein
MLAVTDFTSQKTVCTPSTENIIVKKTEETKAFKGGGHRPEPNAFYGHGNDRPCFIK